MLNKIKYWLDDAKLGMQVGRGDALKRQFLEALDRLSEADAEFQAAFASRAAEVFINTANQYGGHFNNVSKRGHLIIGKQLRKQSNQVFDTDMPHGFALMFMAFLLEAAALPGSAAEDVSKRCNLIFIRHVESQ